MNHTINELRCPACGVGSLALAGGDTVRCGCGAGFPVTRGVIDLLPPATGRRTIAQRLMETPAFTRLYDSRWYRRSGAATALFGCSFDQEEAEILRLLALAPDALALDLACGPGIVTRPIARAVPKGAVIGLDVSWPMLACATDRARGESIGNIMWLRASALAIPLADASIDGVNCSAALHMLPDVPRALAEVLRVLKPGGRFACAVPRRTGRFPERLESAATTWIGLSMRRSEELEPMLESAGFADVTIHHSARAYQIASATKPGTLD